VFDEAVKENEAHIFNLLLIILKSYRFLDKQKWVNVPWLLRKADILYIFYYYTTERIKKH
jgi:hypothetical protein